MMCLVSRSHRVAACDGRDDRGDDLGVRLEDQKTSDSVVGRTNSGKVVSAVHIAARLSRIGWPGRIAKSQRGLEHCLRSSVQGMLAASAYAVH